MALSCFLISSCISTLASLMDFNCVLPFSFLQEKIPLAGGC